MFGLFRVIGVLVRGWFAMMGVVLTGYVALWVMWKVDTLTPPNRVDPKLTLKMAQMDPHDPKRVELLREARRQVDQK